MKNENENPSLGDAEIKSTFGNDSKADTGKQSVKKPESSSKTGLIAVVVIALIVGIIGIGYAYRDTIKDKMAGNSNAVPNKITKEEMELLIKDFNPMQLKQIAENPTQKDQLVSSLKELLAIANQAQKEGLANDPLVKQELESVEESLLAVTYDQELSKGKAEKLPPFSAITEEQVKKYWTSTENGMNPAAKEKKFKTFIDGKIALAKKSGQIPAGQDPSAEELTQAKEAYAKSQIYYVEAKQKLDGLSSLPAEERKKWEEVKKKTELQVRLQKAQILAQNYFQNVLEKKFEVTDAEVAEYIKAHPEMANDGEKKAKAEEVLKKVQDGGDFAELAKEYSDDPGRQEKGGLYEDIAQGQFAPEFEAAAFALKDGEVAPEVVKTNFGYHIIKLIKKTEKTDGDGKATPSMNVRHILISTMVKDPDNPTAREMPAEDFAKAKLQKEKQEKILDEIKKNNPVEVATNFEIPKPSEAELKKMQEDQMQQMQMQQQMQQMPQPGSPDETAKPEAPQEKDKK